MAEVTTSAGRTPAEGLTKTASAGAVRSFFRGLGTVLRKQTTLVGIAVALLAGGALTWAASMPAPQDHESWGCFNHSGDIVKCEPIWNSGTETGVAIASAGALLLGGMGLAGGAKKLVEIGRTVE